MKNTRESANLAKDISETVSEIFSDHEEIASRLRRTLNCLGYAQLNRVHCRIEGDEIVLLGELNSFYLKQVAQSVALKMPGVRNVRNEIVVS